MEEITARRALELLIDVVDAYGPDTVNDEVELHSAWGEAIPATDEHVVRGCRYSYNDAPACLVGHVLYRAGMSVDGLAALDVGGLSAQNLPTWGRGLQISHEAAQILQAAQAHQDLNHTWGEALDKAREEYERGLK